MQLQQHLLDTFNRILYFCAVKMIHVSIQSINVKLLVYAEKITPVRDKK